MDISFADLTSAIPLVISFLVVGALLVAFAYGVVWLFLRYITYDSRKLNAQQKMLEQTLNKYKGPFPNKQNTDLPNNFTSMVQQLTQRVYNLEQEIEDMKKNKT